MTNKQFNKLQISLSWAVVALFLIAAGCSDGIVDRLKEPISNVCLLFAAVLTAANFYKMIPDQDRPDSNDGE